MRQLAILLIFLMLLPTASAEDLYFDLSGSDNETETISNAPARDVSLCYVSEDSSRFTYATRTFEADNVETLIESILSELIGQSNYTDSSGGFHSGSSPEFELACGTLTIDLSLDTAGGRTEEELLIAAAALANSFLGIDEVSAVNILIGGQSFSVSGMPCGAFTESVDSVALLYGDIDTRQASASSDETAEETVIAYFPSSDGMYLLPIATDCSFHHETIVTDVLNTLGTLPGSAPACMTAVSGISELLNSEPVIEMTEDGERVVSIDFSSVFPDYLALSGMKASGFLGAVTLTLTSFVPGISGLYVTINGEPIETIEMPDGSTLRPVNGVLKREYFEGIIGSTAKLYLLNASDRLSAVDTAMGRHSRVTPAGLLSLLFETRNAGELTSAVPEGIGTADILSTEFSGQALTVDLSSNFYTRCQSLNEKEEQMLAYAMINTLCTLSDVKAVSFTIEGRRLDRFVHNIRLSSCLMPDPGLIDTEKGETAP